MNRAKPKYREGQKIRGWTITAMFFIGGKYEYKFDKSKMLIKEAKIKP